MMLQQQQQQNKHQQQRSSLPKCCTSRMPKHNLFITQQTLVMCLPCLLLYMDAVACICCTLTFWLPSC
jgi:hypothetical protein